MPIRYSFGFHLFLPPPPRVRDRLPHEEVRVSTILPVNVSNRCPIDTSSKNSNLRSINRTEQIYCSRQHLLCIHFAHLFFFPHSSLCCVCFLFSTSPHRTAHTRSLRIHLKEINSVFELNEKENSVILAELDQYIDISLRINVTSINFKSMFILPPEFISYTQRNRTEPSGSIKIEYQRFHHSFAVCLPSLSLSRLISFFFCVAARSFFFGLFRFSLPTSIHFGYTICPLWCWRTYWRTATCTHAMCVPLWQPSNTVWDRWNWTEH